MVKSRFALVADLTPGQTILLNNRPLTIIDIFYRKGSLSSFFVLSCRDGERVVKVNVREDGELNVLP